MKPYIYFDNAATSRQKPAGVYQAIETFFREVNCNPGRGAYSLALEAGRHILEARSLLAKFFNVPKPNQVIFTANVTQALNTAIKGLLRPGDHVLTTSMEHNAVARPLTWMRDNWGIEFDAVPCSKEGLLDPGDVVKLARRNTKLLVCTHASNVTGSIIPIVELGAIAKERGWYFVIDAAQTAGALPIDFQAANADVLAFTGHKHLLGPMGTGGFCISLRAAEHAYPLVTGGTGSISDREYQPDFLPDKFESGTLNVPGIAGLAAGVNHLLQVGLETIRAHELLLTEYFRQGLERMDGITVYGPREPRLATGTISINMVQRDNADLSFQLDDQFGIMTRPGLHCAPWAHQTIGTFPMGTLRFSLGVYNTTEEVDFALKALTALK
ncbi:MAG: aminotransferase class V-fold PLP-dependent enzyme [Bacillota bacterium]